MMMVGGENTRTAFICSCGEILKPGDRVTLDGTSGKLFAGFIPIETAFNNQDFQTVLQWADKYRKMKVYASIPGHYRSEAEDAMMLHADGIGCINTDCMFSSTEERLSLSRAVIFAKSDKERAIPLARLCELHTGDFRSIFRAAKGTPVCVQLLDESLHKLLPQSWHEAAEVARQMNRSVAEVKQAMAAMHDTNPAMGLRGCRLTALMPSLTEMQTTAIMSAAIDITMEGLTVHPNIAVPMLTCDHELYVALEIIHSAAKMVVDERCGGAGVPPPPLIPIAGLAAQPAAATTAASQPVPRDRIPRINIGAVLGTPRACLRADSIASMVAFITIDTDDLTQHTYGCTREDASKFMAKYLRDHIFHRDPFRTLDNKGVGSLLRTALKGSTGVSPSIKCGIVGAHTADPSSIFALHDMGVDSITCSPLAVPIAKICAAQANINADRSRGVFALDKYGGETALSAPPSLGFPYAGGLNFDDSLTDEWGNTVVLV